MPEAYLLSVAVEDYSDSRIPSVSYAEDDATGFTEALVRLGIPIQNCRTLLSAQATKTAIESKLRSLLKRVKNDDVFYLFYAGHGFSKNSKNYITCSDTQLDDLDATSIPLQDLFSDIQQVCKKAVVFLDSCESGMPFPKKARSLYSDFQEDELEAFLRDAEYCVCFAACKTGEESRSSSTLGHGIWSFHVIEALSGRAKDAIHKGFVTAQSLQMYLALEVPFSVRKAYTDGHQTPWMVGALSKDFAVADLRTLLAAEAAQPKGLPEVRRFFFRREYAEHVKALRGFQKGYHRVPTRVTDATENFIADIANEQVTEDIDRIFKAVRALGYKSRDISVSPDHGTGTLLTPDFEYRVWISQDPEDPSQALWHYELRNIARPDLLKSDEFNRVFGSIFDEMEIELDGQVRIENIIDILEDAGADVDVPSHRNHCELTVKGVDGTLRISRSGILVQFHSRRAPRLMLEQFAVAQQALMGTYGLGKLLPGAQRKALPK